MLEQKRGSKHIIIYFSYLDLFKRGKPAFSSPGIGRSRTNIIWQCFRQCKILVMYCTSAWSSLALMTARPTAGKIPDLRVIPTGIRLAFLFPIIGGVTLHYTQSPDLRRAQSTSAFPFFSFSSDSAQQHEVNRAQKHPGIVNSEAAVTHSPFL